MHCAIIGDIIKSRTIKDRKESQQKLKTILNYINKQYKEEIASNFTITIGDEFQGLLKNPINLLKIITCIKFHYHPIKIRFGVGIGEITTDINQEISIGTDGPAYYLAREALEKFNEGKYEQPKRDIIILEKNTNRNIINLLNASLSTCYFIESKWSNKNREAIIWAEKNMTQREIAKKLNLDQSSVQSRLSTAGFATYANAKQIINENIIKIWEDINAK